MTITTGTRFGHYEVTAPLGKGGMGEVCLAEDMRLQRKVALKILPAEVITHGYENRLQGFPKSRAVC